MNRENILIGFALIAGASVFLAGRSIRKTAIAKLAETVAAKRTEDEKSTEEESSVEPSTGDSIIEESSKPALPQKTVAGGPKKDASAEKTSQVKPTRVRPKSPKQNKDTTK